jgi:glycine/D-amino acid oxidase-like deaminating enzyme
MDKIYDVIVAGGGVAGTLAAARLAAAHPGRRILLLEREAQLGGRLRTTSGARGSHGYGMNALSDALYELWDGTLRADPDAPELAALAPPRQASMGVLAGNRIVQADIAQWFAAKGARTLGGLAAARQWAELEEILAPGTAAAREKAAVEAAAAAAAEKAAKRGKKGGAKAAAAEAESKDAEGEDGEAAEGGDGEEGEGDDAQDFAHPFSHYWKKPRKAPAAVVLEHFGAAMGIPDVWSAAPRAIFERGAYHSGRLHSGSWDAALQALVELPASRAGVTVQTSSLIVDATLTDGLWTVITETGEYQARALVVAQPPWIAIGWLRRSVWPAHLLQIPSKSKPVTAVVLAERLIGQPAGEFPDVTIVPSERVQIIRTAAGEVVLQATIDFELSLQAPAVVKAVRSLKRARKKLLTLYPGLVTEGNHIALQTVAWAQSPAHTDRKWIDRLGKKSFQSPTLAFCGDAYGAQYDGDANIVRSVVAAVDAVSPTVAKAPVVETVPIEALEALDGDAGLGVPGGDAGTTELG